MPRTARIAPAGVVFHALNRANARETMFRTESDFKAFERIMRETADLFPVDLFAYCLMPNHWHMVVRPRKEKSLASFFHRLTITHVRRLHLHRETVGTGHLYQGPFKSFPVQTDGHFLRVCRYVERNPLRADLVARAQDWPWGSLYPLAHRLDREESEGKPGLAPWPVERPGTWIEEVNSTVPQTEVDAIRQSVIRGRPFGKAGWQKRTANQLKLESTMRSRGRPRGSSRERRN